MKLEGYKSGIFMRMNDYSPFILSKINYEWSWEDSKLNKMSAEVNRQIGELNGYSKLLPNMDAYTKMLMVVEANKTSKIEGTNIKMEDCLLQPSDIEAEKKEDWDRIQRHIDAMNYGIQQIGEQVTVGTKLLREIHNILLQGEKGDEKNLGKLRGMQTWVGGTSILDAIYIPPPHTEIVECLADFEQFIANEDTNTPDVVKLAMLHYQFESIHPFVGGNGRIGRMLIPLYLRSKGFLDKPCLFVSEYLEQNKEEYFNRLAKVRTSSDIIGWINFFLEAMLESAKRTNNRLQQLSQLKNEMDNVVMNTPVKPDNAKKIVETFYKEPIVDVLRLGELSGIKGGTMRTVINSLIDKGIVIKVKGVNKNKIVCFKKYTDIFFETDLIPEFETKNSEI